LDTTIYNEQNIQVAMQKINAANKAAANFGDDLPWGDNITESSDDADVPW
jgi:hypothetical protein